MKTLQKIRLAMYLFVLMFIAQNSFSQKFIDTYYRYNWIVTPSKDDASFFSHSINTDSGWFRKDYLLNPIKNSVQMVGLYEDKENNIPNGTFMWLYANTTVKSYGKYEHGLKDGLWQDWFSDGSIKDSLNYLHGNPTGVSKSWYKNGYPKDSLNINENGDGIYGAWFNNGTPSEIGRYRSFKKNGKWAYYTKLGKLSSVETYANDTLISFQYFDENGNKLLDTVARSTPAKFKKGDKGWNNYITGSLHFPRNVSILNTDHIVVVVDFTVDEDGNVKDAEVSLPFYPAFDKEALRAISQSPQWIPAISHNRRISYNSSFAVEFSQSFQ